jgi:hypothetical protein
VSADRWTACPRCQADHDAEVTKARQAADAAYGTASIDEFDRLREKATAMAGPIDNTLREDYDIGIDEGTFYVDFRAACVACDFRFAFKHQQEPTP